VASGHLLKAKKEATLGCILYTAAQKKSLALKSHNPKIRGKETKTGWGTGQKEKLQPQHHC